MVTPPEALQPTSEQAALEHATAQADWGELNSVIDGISDPEYIAQLHEARASDESFLNEFKQILGTVNPENPKDQKTEEAQTIKSFFSEKLASGEELSSQQIATVLYELKHRGDDAGVVEVFEAGIPFGLDKSAVIREFYAVSLNKVGRLEDSVSVLESLMADDNARVGEVAGILGKVHKLKSKESTDEQQKIEHMRRSVAVLQEGFYATYEFYPGINLVYNQIELANMTGDPALIEKAFNDAELVMYSAKKAGAERTADYWTAATLLESSIFAGEVTPQMVQHCLETSENDWELESTIGNLKGVAETIRVQLDSGQLDTDTRERLASVLGIIVGSDSNPGVLVALERGEITSVETEKSPNDAILEHGFMYGETTTLIGGNIQFGGQLQSHIVNRFDVKVAHSVMEHFGLDSISTVEEFNQVVDGIIRQQFGTSELEDLHSEAHEVYDTQIKNLLDVLGINGQVDKSVVDSRTNVMVDFLLGKGDCRQHAHAKQLLFDSWKTFKLNNLIGSLKDAQITPDSADDERARDQINELLNKQMMVFDSIVESQVQMNGLYDPKTDPNGSLIESADFEPIEDHTWNGIITLNENGHVDSIEMADSFYQEEYGFGGRGQVITGPASYTADGMVVTEISAVGEDGVLKKVPVRLKPTPYAGSRGKRMLTHTDVGAAHVRGVELGYDVPHVADVFSSLKVGDLWQKMAQR
jgi:hypothetical protein